ncbi:MAG: DUF3109 family protein [Prolixibacteraceae bacterium]|jgi:hypothetical protein|nr:DUF3109 family protein [Prolixibacteraceae bacterium]
MIQIGKTIVSFDIFDKHFLCDLNTCKGVCCVDGDSGAPLTQEEAKLIEENYPAFEPYLDKKYKKVIGETGFSVIDSDGDLVTPLYNNLECVYTYSDENGITKCAIEKAYFEGKSTFRKPVSCHLFPVRITEYKDFDAVNYQQLDICKAARTCGKAKQLPLYIFLKDALIRKYGKEWYAELEVAASQIHNIKR